jgi:DNA-binding LytR/AlgR family response regulator
MQISKAAAAAADWDAPDRAASTATATVNQKGISLPISERYCCRRRAGRVRTMASVEHIEIETGDATILVNVAHIVYVTEQEHGALVLLTNGQQLETSRKYSDFVHYFDAGRTAAAVSRMRLPSAEPARAV